MRIVWTVLIGAAALAWSLPASAQNYPWCAEYTMRGGATNCGFSTPAQCRASISGIGGYCRRNLFYIGPDQPPPRKKRQR